MLENMTEPLLRWYEKNHRELPWREQRDAYRIWVSEIMLQQTRVEAVRPYFERFLQALPTVQALAQCPEEKLLKLWEGLGYYNRVKNMQKAAKILCSQYGGKLPADHQALLALPGIGSYTAGAIASIAYGIPVPAVDGNVLRVLARLRMDDGDIMKQSVRSRVERELLAVMPADRPGEYNQALMELGALVCVPNGAPLCEKCPIKELCKARKSGTIESYPVKEKKAGRKLEKRTVLLILDGSHVAVRKRPERGLLAGLYEFPNEKGWLSQDEALSFVENQGLTPLQILPLPGTKHIFSHVEWHMKGFLIRLKPDGEKSEKLAEGCFFVEKQQIRTSYALPGAFVAYSALI